MIRFAALVAAMAMASQAALGRDAAWSEDVAFFAREFAAGQRDFEQLYPRRTFDPAVQAITRTIPTSSDADLVLTLMRLVAGAHVGHTTLRFPTSGPLAFHRLPLGFQWCADGLVVTTATDPYRDAIGLRVAAIGSLTPEEAESRLAPYLSYETEGWLHQQSQSLLLAVEALRAIGQVDADGRIRLVLVRPDAMPLTLVVAPVPWSDPTPRVTLVEARNLSIGPARRQPGRYYRYEILADTRVLYIRYNRCANDPQQSFVDFAREIFAAVDANPGAIDRVVIDLRANGGGDSTIIKPLLDGLRARKALITWRRLFVLVGPATFSSGLLAAIALKDDLGAILIGEPPGEKPNSYGEVRTLTLPHSGLVVQYSTKYFRMVRNGDPPTYEPDVIVRQSMGDLLAGRDPVFDAALGRR